MFPEGDDPVLRYRFEEGKSIEPFHFMPIIPMSLVNGSDGIATGWRSQIPAFNPLEIVDVIEDFLKTDTWDSRQIAQLMPFVRGFKGKCECLEPTGKELVVCKFSGLIHFKTPKTLVISELPPGKWTTPYLDFVKEHVVLKSGKSPDSVRNLGTESFVHIEIGLSKETAHHYLTQQSRLSAQEFQQMLRTDWRLEVAVSMRSNTSILLNVEGEPRSFTIPEILDTHAKARLAMYETRKQYLLDALEAEQLTWGIKVRFIECLITSQIQVQKRLLADIQAQMVSLGFAEETHDMLLKLPLSVQTKETVDAWADKVRSIQATMKDIRAQTPKQFWAVELVQLRKAIVKQNKDLVVSNTN